MKTLVSVGILLSILFALCTPVQEVHVEILQPAEVCFPDDIYSLAFLLPDPTIKIDKRIFDDAKLEVNPKQEFWDGISEFAANSPRFNHNNMYLFKDSSNSIKDDTLLWERIDEIADSLDVDAVVDIHVWNMIDSVDKDLIDTLGAEVFNYKSTWYRFIYHINAWVEWRIYDVADQSVLSKRLYKDTFSWESTKNLDAIGEIFFSVAYWSGYDMGEILFPYWLEEKRIYYNRSNEYFSQANDHVENENWSGAIENWKQTFQHNDMQDAYRAAHNIAFACEMLGKIDLAVYWAEKALEIRDKSITRKYLEVLYKRKKELEKIDQQMPI